MEFPNILSWIKHHFCRKKAKVKSSRRDYAISIKNCADILLHKLCFKLHVTPASNKSTITS